MAYKLPIVDTHIKINDYSIIKEQSDLVNIIPLYLSVFSSDKGPEEMVEIAGDEFFKLYGDRESISFKRHGQALIQAAASIEAGARVLCKRVVADDATLANITIYAEIKTIERKIIKTHIDNKGRVITIYEDPSKPSSDENESIGWDYDGKWVPKLIEDSKGRNTILIRFFSKSMENVKTLDDIKKKVKTEQIGDVYPLFTITENGRGESGKSIKIVPSFYTRAGSVSAMRHTIQVVENNEITEEADFIFHPDVMINKLNRGMNRTINALMKQIRCYQYEDSVYDLYDKISEVTKGDDVKEDVYMNYLKSVDILFGKNRRNYIEEVMCISSPTDKRNDQFDNTPTKNVVNLTTPAGLTLENGTNGAFKNDPIERPEYIDQICKFFDGDFTNEVYDLHNHKIDLIIDANYDPKIKTKIEEFVIQFRDDCSYIRDYGLGMNSMQEILQTKAGFENNYKCSDYYLSYDIINPYDGKQIPVTMTFELAELFVDHFKQGRHRPCAGIPYNFILKRAIKGTESFIPTKHKYTDQRETLTDKRINYAIYHDAKLVVETLFTSQEEYSQLSFMSNVFNIQRLVKLIRTKCPQIRYTFMHGKDLDNYKQDIQHELNLEAANFARLDVKFDLNKVSVTNKQIHVIVEVTCKDFIASEFFEINVINLD